MRRAVPDEALVSVQIPERPGSFLQLYDTRVRTGAGTHRTLPTPRPKNNQYTGAHSRTHTHKTTHSHILTETNYHRGQLCRCYFRSQHEL